MEERDRPIVDDATPIVPRISDQVHYVLEAGPNQGECRPAFVVRVWGTAPTSAVNLLVLVDGENDQHRNNTPPGGAPLVIWRTSKLRDDNRTPGTWHYSD